MMEGEEREHIMSSLLNSVAVGRRKDEEAGELLQAYIDTQPEMAFTHSAAPKAGAQPRGASAGDSIDPTRM